MCCHVFNFSHGETCTESYEIFGLDFKIVYKFISNVNKAAIFFLLPLALINVIKNFVIVDDFFHK